MTDLDTTLRAVCADPADDLARLAHADALEERALDDDLLRAEYVRLHMELACTPARIPSRRRGTSGRWVGGVASNPAHDALVAQVLPLHGLRLGWAERWLSSLPPPPPGAPWHTTSPDRPLWERGFVRYCPFHARHWLLCGVQAVLSQPLTSIHLTGIMPYRLSLPSDEAGAPYAYTWEFGRTPPVGRHSLDLLPREWRPYFPPGEEYPGPRRARQAANRAALAWARDAAGLPPLEIPSAPV